MRTISALSGSLQPAASPAQPSGAASALPETSPPSVKQPQKTLAPPPLASPDLPEIRGRKMKIGANNCPSELRRPIASPYVVIQKYNKAYYLKKQYWAKIYEVQYSLLRNPISVACCEETNDKEEAVEGTSKKSFVAATGDEIGMYGEGATPEEAASELQVKLSSSILQMLEEGHSHCLPTKRKYQDVLLKDFEEEMVSHGVKILSPPKYVPIQVAFDIGMKKSAPAQNAIDAGPANESQQEQQQQQQATTDAPTPSTSANTTAAEPAAAEESNNISPNPN